MNLQGVAMVIGVCPFHKLILFYFYDQSIFLDIAVIDKSSF